MNHSEKTKAGISKAIASGIKWGRSGSVLAKKNKDTAQKFAENLRPLILELMLGAGSRKGRGPTALADTMNTLEVPTARGGKWHPATVHRLMKRLEPSLSKSFKKANDAKGEKFHKEKVHSELAGHLRHVET